MWRSRYKLELVCNPAPQLALTLSQLSPGDPQQVGLAINQPQVSIRVSSRGPLRGEDNTWHMIFDETTTRPTVGARMPYCATWQRYWGTHDVPSRLPGYQATDESWLS